VYLMNRKIKKGSLTKHINSSQGEVLKE